MNQETKPEAKAEKPVVAKVQQNGIIRPSNDTLTGKVWSIADAISAKKQAPADRSEVMQEAQKQGINESTAATQYGRWRKFFGIVTPKKEKLSDEEKAAARAARAAEKVAVKEAEAAAKAAEKAAKAQAAQAAKDAKAAAKAAKAAPAPAGE